MKTLICILAAFGISASAHAQLDPRGVTSVNGNTGAVTSAQVAASLLGMDISVESVAINGSTILDQYGNLTVPGTTTLDNSQIATDGDGDFFTQGYYLPAGQVIDALGDFILQPGAGFYLLGGYTPIIDGAAGNINTSGYISTNIDPGAGFSGDGAGIVGYAAIFAVGHSDAAGALDGGTDLSGTANYNADTYNLVMANAFSGTADYATNAGYADDAGAADYAYSLFNEGNGTDISNVTMLDLPTSPGSTGTLWSNLGVVTVSP